MFFEKGWGPLANMMQEGWQLLTDNMGIPGFDEATTEDERIAAVEEFERLHTPDFHSMAWDLLYDAAERQAVGCTTGAGRTVLVTAAIVTPADPSLTQGAYIDLFEGYIGSGVVSNYEWDDGEKLALYGRNFQYCPVVVRDAIYNKFITMDSEQNLSDAKIKPDEYYVQEIITAYDKGRPITKS